MRWNFCKHAVCQSGTFANFLFTIVNLYSVPPTVIKGHTVRSSENYDVYAQEMHIVNQALLQPKPKPPPPPPPTRGTRDLLCTLVPSLRPSMLRYTIIKLWYSCINIHCIPLMTNALTKSSLPLDSSPYHVYAWYVLCIPAC